MIQYKLSIRLKSMHRNCIFEFYRHDSLKSLIKTVGDTNGADTTKCWGAIFLNKKHPQIHYIIKKRASFNDIAVLMGHEIGHYLIEYKIKIPKKINYKNLTRSEAIEEIKADDYASAVCTALTITSLIWSGKDYVYANRQKDKENHMRKKVLDKHILGQ